MDLQRVNIDEHVNKTGAVRNSRTVLESQLFQCVYMLSNRARGFPCLTTTVTIRGVGRLSGAGASAINRQWKELHVT
jgi:hypothetical protein